MENKNTHDNNSHIRKSQIFRYLGLLIILGLAVHFILPQIASFQHSYEVIKNMASWGVGLAILAQTASYVGSGYLIKSLAELSDSKLSIFRGSMITLAGASFGMIAGGMFGSGAAIFRWMKKEHAKPEVATLAGTIPGVLNDILLLGFSLVGLLHLLIVHQLTNLQAFSYAAILVLLIGVVGFLVWGVKKQDSLIGRTIQLGSWIAKIRHRNFNLEKTENSLKSLFTAVNLLLTGGWHKPLFGEFMGVLFDLMTLYFLFIAAGYPIHFGALLTGYGLPLIFGRLAFIIPGGVGIVESTMSGLYTGLGIPGAIAVVVVLAYRILSFWLPLILGFPLILYLERNSKIPSEVSK